MGCANPNLIQSLDSGYDAFVGENGVLLSGGRRHSIAIARQRVYFLQNGRMVASGVPSVFFQAGQERKRVLEREEERTR